MAKPNRLLLIPLFTTILLLASAITESQANYSTTVTSAPKPEKLTHLHFFFHIHSDNATTATLTEGPDMSSKVVGTSRWLTLASTSAVDHQKKPDRLEIKEFVFTEGEFKGSTLSLLAWFDGVKATSIPIVGGTGAFMFAKGYVTARIVDSGLAGKDVVVEFDVFVSYY